MTTEKREAQYLVTACRRIQQLEAMRDQQAAEIKDLKARLLTAAGDDLCRLTQEEIKAYTSGAVPIPPKSEFMPSCERFWEQTANVNGVNENCLTNAQLVAENASLRTIIADAKRMVEDMQERDFGTDSQERQVFRLRPGDMRKLAAKIDEATQEKGTP